MHPLPAAAVAQALQTHTHRRARTCNTPNKTPQCTHNPTQTVGRVGLRTNHPLTHSSRSTQPHHHQQAPNSCLLEQGPSAPGTAPHKMPPHACEEASSPWLLQPNIHTACTCSASPGCMCVRGCCARQPSTGVSRRQGVCQQGQHDQQEERHKTQHHNKSLGSSMHARMQMLVGEPRCHMASVCCVFVCVFVGVGVVPPTHTTPPITNTHTGVGGRRQWQSIHKRQHATTSASLSSGSKARQHTHHQAQNCCRTNSNLPHPTPLSLPAVRATQQSTHAATNSIQAQHIQPPRQHAVHPAALLSCYGSQLTLHNLTTSGSNQP